MSASMYLYTTIALALIGLSCFSYFKIKNLKAIQQELYDILSVETTVKSLIEVIRSENAIYTSADIICSTLSNLIKAEGICVYLLKNEKKNQLLGEAFKDKEKKAIYKSFVSNSLIAEAIAKDSTEGFIRTKVSPAENKEINLVLASVETDGEYEAIVALFLKVEQEKVIPSLITQVIFYAKQMIALTLDIEKKLKAEKLMEEHQKIEKKAKELTRRLENEVKNNEMQSEFIAIVSHEFRTPMAVINSSSRLISTNIEQIKKSLSNSKLDHNIQDSVDLNFSKINQQLNNIDIYINRLSNLIEGTLQMCTLDSKKSDYMPTSINLENEIAVIINNLKNVRDSVKVNLELIGKDHHIFFDNKHLHLILSNLISNALKYSHDNSQILVQVSSSGKDSVLKITDYGIGIPKDEMDKLFSKFFRASNAKSLFGTGIGLYVSKKLIELNDAKIEVESRENQGTTFTVTFPKYLAQSNFKEVANG